MRSYVYDTLRAAICALTLDQAFDSKDEISMAVKQNLESVFHNYGFTICQALITDISPNNRVRDAMNEINSSMRIKEASYQRAEGEKILKVLQPFLHLVINFHLCTYYSSISLPNFSSARSRGRRRRQRACTWQE
jgi:regulator of protease activity HflC (stomatin/prohibitin superfamily)